MRRIGLLGGTFDPVNNGHIRLAVEMVERLQLDEIHLIPAAVPPLRDQPRVAGSQRLSMLATVIEEFDSFVIDDRELHRDGPSYTIDTLEELRQEHPDDSMSLIIGMDAFLQLEQWHRWKDLRSHVNVAVATRPGYPLPTTGRLREVLQKHFTTPLESLSESRNGIVKVIEIPSLHISATYIRKQIANGKDVRLLTLPTVIDFIKENGLYGYRQQPAS